tara:strand:- start:57 stop:443 length:387 start_codon:yes stop_codon:yes gene_type:complete
MVLKNNTWNISKVKGEGYAHKYIIEILNDSKDNKISLSELIILLNQRTKHIKFIINKKKKPFSVYLKTIYGNIYKFIENYSFYKVINIGANIQIQLVDKELTHNKLTDDIINEYREWTLINTEDFEFI